MLRMFVQGLMSAEADALCGAAYRERSAGRANRRNGYRPRRWDTASPMRPRRFRGVFNTADAITNAARRLAPGDVILIELQATGPRGRYVAMQYWDDVYSAILATVGRGISVVEAAGNGGEGFDRPDYRVSGLQKDSGAIVVGAGVPPTNHFDVDRGYQSIGVPRSRIWFSNYGRIVDVQAWGWHVTTLGYGDAQGGGENRWYTLRFSGTSSASPIVTGAVACIQGHARARRGRPLTPEQVRRFLVQTGTRQEAGPGRPVSQHIGPQPHLPAALRACNSLAQKCRMKSSTEETKFRNPVSTFARASSGERAHRPRDGSMQMKTWLLRAGTSQGWSPLSRGRKGGRLWLRGVPAGSSERRSWERPRVLGRRLQVMGGASV